MACFLIHFSLVLSFWNRSMRPILTKTALAVFLCSPFMVQQSYASEWSGSYSAGGQCYCVGELPGALSSTIVPTPIGGQTISQVCKRVGEGPGLLKASGLFNFPVYKDPQCGHGPYPVGSEPLDPGCLGSLDGKQKGCESAGSLWDLDLAFGKVAAPAAATPDLASETTAQGLIEKPVVSSVNVERASGQSKDGGDKKILKATIIKSPSTAASSFDPAKSVSSSESAKARKAFTGKTITIDGQRYLQAHSGVPAAGGEPGSRIILDDLLYLRDDAKLDPADLYQDRKQQKKTQSSTVKALPKTKQLNADNQATRRQIESKRALSLALEVQNTRSGSDPKPSLKPENSKLAAAQTAGQEERSASSQSLHAQAVAKANRMRQQQAQRDKRAALEASTKADDLTAQKAANQKAELDREALLQAEANEQALKTENAQRLAAEKKRQKSIDEATEQVKSKGSANARSVADAETPEPGSALLTALRLPADTRQSSRDFAYIEAMPVSYDVGGNGVLLEGSASSHTRFHYVGSVGATAEYQEVMVGAGYYLTPADADRLTVVLVAGLEYGNFELSDDQLSVDFTDSGVFLGASTRFVLNNRFELKGGLGYSTFFEGDAIIFGGGYYHINRQLDIVSRFEIGDNDLLGIGVRFYY